MASLFKIKLMVMDFISMLRETDMNLKTMKTKRILVSFEENFTEEEKSSSKMEINTLVISKMEDDQDGVKWSTKISKQSQRLLIQVFMKVSGKEEKETVKVK